MVISETSKFINYTNQLYYDISFANIGSTPSGKLEVSFEFIFWNNNSIKIDSVGAHPSLFPNSRAKNFQEYLRDTILIDQLQTDSLKTIIAEGKYFSTTKDYIYKTTGIFEKKIGEPITEPPSFDLKEIIWK